MKSKYGKLHVNETVMRDGRRYAVVTCTCGARRRVLVDHLKSGKTKSCGAPACRVKRHSDVKLDRSYHPRDLGYTAKHLREIWTAMRDSKITHAESARGFGINYNTFRAMERSIKRAGGVERYIRVTGAGSV